ncbi:hypothetical protein [Nonomuraea sp. NPDC049028]|uniref:hypothetical protein n=1 Tax=Nonomuraea sp. NPDC049028 TaxID=3364348 RepID=UPI0037140F04
MLPSSITPLLGQLPKKRYESEQMMPMFPAASVSRAGNIGIMGPPSTRLAIADDQLLVLISSWR